MEKRLQRWVQRIPKDFWLLLGLIILSRLGLTLLGTLVRTQWFSFTKDWALPGPLSSHVWLNVWGLWDTGWYYRIATEWYSGPQQLGFAFFPLYPGIVRILGEFFGHHFPIGLLVSNIALILSCWLLMKLAGDRRRGWWAVSALVSFPAAFVLSGMFTESLYLAIALGTFLAAIRGKWWLAGLLGVALSFARPVGFLIAAPIGLEYLRQRGWSIKKLDRNVLWIFLIPIGLPVWSWYNHLLTGDWLNFVHVQAAWRRGATDPISALMTALRADNFYDQALAGSVILVALFLILFRKYLTVPEKSWAWISLLIPLFSGIYSMPRYFLVMFPLYLGFARAPISTFWRWVILGIMTIIQIGLFIYWPKPNSWVV